MATIDDLKEAYNEAHLKNVTNPNVKNPSSINTVSVTRAEARAKKDFELYAITTFDSSNTTHTEILVDIVYYHLVKRHGIMKKSQLDALRASYLQDLKALENISHNKSFTPTTVKQNDPNKVDSTFLKTNISSHGGFPQDSTTSFRNDRGF